jgi:hypothetical protein
MQHGCDTERRMQMEPAQQAVTALALQFDGVAAVVRALISELTAKDTELPKRLARAAGSEMRERMKDSQKEARDIVLLTVARTCGLPAGFLIGQ